VGALPIGEMDRPAKRNQAGFLDCLRESGMRRHTVRNGVDRRLGIKGDDANLDHVQVPARLCEAHLAACFAEMELR